MRECSVLFSRRQFLADKSLRSAGNARTDEQATKLRSCCSGNRFLPTSYPRKRIGARPRERLPAITPAVRVCLFPISENCAIEGAPAPRIAPCRSAMPPRYANVDVAPRGIRVLLRITFSLSLERISRLLGPVTEGSVPLARANILLLLSVICQC